jgi:hypothetical protein
VAGVRQRKRVFVLAGSAEPSIPLAQGRDRTRKDGGMSSGSIIASCSALLLIARSGSWRATALRGAFGGCCAWKCSRRINRSESCNEDWTAALQS